ncbi:MAG: hypothetical protein ACD_41C00003G0001 [uncultured bacterium]|nr:MAG: hypothetical protein ACD_41C00003G0001 [uncultured bacterium]
MAKDHVKSGKISSTHTTFIEAAVPIIKQVVQQEVVRRVTPGFIKSGLDTLKNYSASVKISIAPDYVRLLIRAKISVQEIHIYTADAQATSELVSRTALSEGYHIHFDKREHVESTLPGNRSSRDRR